MIIKLTEATSFLRIARIPPYVAGATTLTAEGFKKLPKALTKYKETWWLPQKENDLGAVPCVTPKGALSAAPSEEKHAVRPLLIIDLSISTYGIGDKFTFSGKDFQIISLTDGIYAFCLDDIGSTAFDVAGTRFRRRGNGNATSGDIWGSDYDKFITDWFKKNQEGKEEYNTKYTAEKQKLPKDAKFKLTHEIKLIDGAKCYRILATKSFGNVKAGEKGGYTDSFDSIPMDVSDTSWVYDNAAVTKGAKLSGNSKVRENARVSGPYTEVKNDSDVYGNAKVSTGVIDHSIVLGDARISASIPSGVELPDSVKEYAPYSETTSGIPRLLDAQVGGNAVVCADTRLTHALVGGNAVVADTQVGDSTVIYAKAYAIDSKVGKNCTLYGDTVVVGATVPDNTELKGKHWDKNGAPLDRPNYTIVAYELRDNLQRLVDKGEEIKVDVWSNPDMYLKFKDKVTAETLKDAAEPAQKFLDSGLYVEVRDETSGQKRQFVPGPDGAKLVTRFRTTSDFTEG